jgi:hypothetical protein
LIFASLKMHYIINPSRNYFNHLHTKAKCHLSMYNVMRNIYNDIK